ncbi:MAG TPA: ferredoxin reductase family protein [Candidatus Nanopelagicales bacterium]|nr:ferredoxin reductase family protein [Candidatus Nanopelagicales bacterium]
MSTTETRPAARVAPAAGPRRRAPFPASPDSRVFVGDVLVWIAGLGLGVVVAIELLTRTSLSGPGALLTEAGRWSALVGTYASLLLLALVARVPILERSVGMDRLMSWHRKLGPVALLLIAAHVVLVTAGYAASTAVSYLAQTWDFMRVYPWMLPALAGFVLMIVGGMTSWRVARRRMKYETWWVTHLYFYLAIALAYLHQVMYGQQFVDHAWARWIWVGMYAVTAGLLVVYRFGAPVWQSLRMGLRVHAVERESADTVSVWIRGKDVDRFALRGGQFFGFRFLTRDGWWQSHPYSVSAGSSREFIRVTIKDLGDHSRSTAQLARGTRVVLEGPYGVFTADDRRTDHVVLVAGGVGITPVRAILDDLPPDVEIDLLYRAPRADTLVLRDELEAIARVRGRSMRLRYLVGPRRDYPLNARTLQHLVPEIASADVYACGPADLVAAVHESAEVLGIPEDRIHDEAFSFHSPDHYAFERTTS